MSKPTTLNIGDPDRTAPPQAEHPAAGNGSTGPRTAAGKQRSSRNALRHGLAATDIYVAEHEQEEFDAFKSDLLREIQPIGPTQMILFNALLLASWNQLRIARMESELLDRGPEALKDPETRKALELLNRYQARHERSFYRARKEIEQLQTAEVVRQLMPEEVQAATPPLANPMKIHTAKRTADVAWIDGNQLWATPVRTEFATNECYHAATEANVRR
jgi:hypothetical protein